MARIPFSLPPNTKIEGPGHCIYCGAAGVALTSEHVIPFFTGGTMELLGSSCLACNKITSRIDGYCAYRIMHGFRHHHGISSRTKSKPNTVPVRFQTPSGKVVREVPFADAPKLMLLPEYDLPHMLTNGPRNGIVTPKSMTLWTTGDFADRVKKLQQPGDTGWSIDAGGNFELFLRFVAKTALSGAVAMLGYDSQKSPLGDVVLGKDKSVRYFVGGDGSKTGVPLERRFADLVSETTAIGFQKWQPPVEHQPELLAAEVTFFKESGMPTYYAVVGPSPPEDVETLAQDFANKTDEQSDKALV